MTYVQGSTNRQVSLGGYVNFLQQISGDELKD